MGLRKPKTDQNNIRANDSTYIYFRKVLVVHYHLHNILQIDEVLKGNREFFLFFYLVDEILIQSNLVTPFPGKQIYKL